MGTDKKNHGQNLDDKFKGLDSFSPGFNFKMPGGKDTQETHFGAILSIVLWITLIAYGYLQMARLLRYGETVVTMSVRESYFDTNYTFGSEDGLSFAFAITAYDGNRSVTEDPDYGVVKVKIVSWGIEEDAQSMAGGELETHPCSR